MSRLAGRLALVTGASGEIGSAIARRLASDGAAVIVHYHSDLAGADATVRAIERAGGTAEAIGADLAEPDGAASLVVRLDAALAGRYAGRLDVVVNNAGTFAYGSLAETTDETFDRTFAINVRAPFVLAREAARRMTPVGFGRIVNVGSVFGAAAPAPNMAVYCGSKFALAGLTRAWSRDLGTVGITVNAVAPALIVAAPHPTTGPIVEARDRYASVGRFGGGDDVAAAVSYLASPEAAYVNGACIDVDGGWSA